MIEIPGSRCFVIVFLILGFGGASHADDGGAAACDRLEAKFDYDAQEEDSKGETRFDKALDQDACFIHNRGWNALLGSMRVTADGGLSNGVFDSASINQRHVSELSETEFQYGVNVGYQDRPLLRDIWLLSGNTARVKAYRDRKGDFYRWGLMDALTMKAKVGWGTTIEPDDDKERFTTSEDLIFEVGVQYSLPLENFGFPFKED